MSKFAERFSNLMKRYNLNTIDLNEILGISTTQLGRYASGYYEPSIDNALKICNHFNCSFDFILGLDEVPNRYGSYKEPDYKKFIERYEELLDSKGTNHFRVAKDAKFNRNNLIYWKKNKVLPTLDILFKISMVLEISVDYLLGRIDVRSKNEF